MSKIDFHDLDGQILRTFLVILEESSVSKAAERLGVTQSAVSHTLSKLRKILGDPLFVRSGQGLTPTEKAMSLKAPVQKVLDQLHSLTHERPFNPTMEKMHFVIAANDMQRDLIFPELVRSSRHQGIELSLELKPSGVPSVSMLRDAHCDLIITPHAPDAQDLMQYRLFSGEWKVFYDASRRGPPKSIDEYMSAKHVSVHFALGGTSNDVLRTKGFAAFPDPTVTVSNFAGLPPFILGTEMLSTQVEFMIMSSLRELAMAPLPFETEPLDVFMIWHERSQNDPAHKWLRERVREISKGIGLRKSLKW